MYGKKTHKKIQYEIYRFDRNEVIFSKMSYIHLVLKSVPLSIAVFQMVDISYIKCPCWHNHVRGRTRGDVLTPLLSVTLLFCSYLGMYMLPLSRLHLACFNLRECEFPTI